MPQPDGFPHAVAVWLGLASLVASDSLRVRWLSAILMPHIAKPPVMR